MEPSPRLRSLRLLGAAALTLLAGAGLDPGGLAARPGSPTPAHRATAATGASESASPSAVPNGTSGGWESQAIQQIAEEEYQVSWQTKTLIPGLDAAWQAPNRAQNLRSYFTGEGVRVIPREGSTPAWEWGLELAGVGHGSSRQEPGGASLAPEKNRITFKRQGLTEWYLNDHRGLEQGFTLHSSPRDVPGSSREESGRPALLVLALRLTGSLSARPSSDGASIDFMTGGGVLAVRYGELKATDARGRVLPARMEAGVEGGQPMIRLVVDDRGAAYPIAVDPLATSPAWSAESDQASAWMGWSAGTAGDVNGDGFSDVIVGAPLFDNGQADEGRAFVFYGSASGLSSGPAWSADSGQASAQFGYSVSTAGDVNGDGFSDVIIGAVDYDNGQTDEGRAYVYYGSASGLSLTADWTAESDQASALFGYSVSTAGDVNGDGYSDVIVGALFYDNGQTDEGRAFVYHGSASGLSLAPDWTAEPNVASAQFGIAVATAGDVNGDGYSDVIVGANNYTNGQAGEGAAFAYYGSASGLSPTPNWSAEGNQAGAEFGRAVGTAGDTNGDGYSDVLVGSNSYDDPEVNEGRAFLYAGSASGLGAASVWAAESNQAGAQFGLPVGTAGDVNGDGYADVIIGAHRIDNPEADEGRAYLYLGQPGTYLTASPAWTAEGDQASAWFGLAAATAGDVNGDGYSDVIVGAPLYDDGEADEGKVSVYYGSPGITSTTLGWGTSGTFDGGGLGYSVASAGDLDGDGFSDVAVSVPLYDEGLSDEGRVYVYYGEPADSSGLHLSLGWDARGDQAGAWFGWSVASAGDVNGDGYSDLIVGAPYYSNGETWEGRAYLYYGSSFGLSLTPDLIMESNQAGVQFGRQVGTAGDVNGDGYSDVFISRPIYQGAFSDEGAISVYLGSPSGLRTSPDWTVTGGQNGALLQEAASAGDVNRDGYSDLIVASPSYDDPEVDEGKAWVYLGSPAGLALTPIWSFETDQSGANIQSVASAGDVNGDGYSDVVVGAPHYANTQSDQGRAYLFLGSPSGPSLAPDWIGEGDQAGAEFGQPVASAGDVNGDGYSDVIVAAQYYDNTFSNEGRVYLYLGSATGLATTPAWHQDGGENACYLGYSISSAGDVNGDGYADILLGTPEGGTMDIGYAWIYLGNGAPVNNGGNGVQIAPRQVRNGTLLPIAPLGMSNATDGVTLRAVGRSSYGSGHVRMEAEVKPLGTPFDGSGTVLGPSWSFTGPILPILTTPVTGLASGTVYHWRLRLRYEKAGSPFQHATPWLGIPANGWQEADFRTPAMADISVSQTDSPDPVLSGLGNVTYSIQIGNAGPDTANVTLDDTLPVSGAFVSATPSQGSCEAPSGGHLLCLLGSIANGGSASLSLVVTPPILVIMPGMNTATMTNAVIVTHAGTDPTPSDNTSSEDTLVVGAGLGDRVWLDMNADGIQDPGEPGVGDVVVGLYDGGGALLSATFTASDGSYFFNGLGPATDYRLRFFPPVGYSFTLQDQGADDALDSDADPITGQTPVINLSDPADPTRWDAGLFACLPPDEPAYIYVVTLSTDGNDYPILNFQDPNQPAQVTGYNIYRSSDPGLPAGSWTQVASNVVDMDAGTVNYQWVDTSGDVSPTGVWYYKVAAYNSGCPAEGPW